MEWWQVLQQPALRLVRSNPAADPSGRAILFTLMLAAKKYQQPDLLERIAGPLMNPQQILTGGDTQQRLAAGELDASASYGVGPEWSHLPYLSLPADINLSGDNLHALHPDLKLNLNNRTFNPESLIFYAAALNNAANPKGAAAFVDWLGSDEAQKLLATHRFNPPGAVPALRG
ncbi:substrate-binding domain-containing protein [Granulicella tundricola]|uniref:substrate-binding domain-containing protein n=1 Tax=Granulicella tundricola TaxID=940615 RepID=UPI0001DB7C61